MERLRPMAGLAEILTDGLEVGQIWSHGELLELTGWWSPNEKWLALSAN